MTNTRRTAEDSASIISKHIKDMERMTFKICQLDVNRILNDWKGTAVMSIYKKELKTIGKPGDIIELKDKFLIQYNIGKQRKAICIPFPQAIVQN